MNIYRGVYRGSLFSLAMLLTIAPFTANADDKVKTVEVDCTKGKTIAKALERGNEDRPLVVVVQGICSENVVIDRDDVTLRGDEGGAGVTGLDSNKDTILIDGARRVVIEKLIVTGGKSGIAGARGASFTVRDSTIQNSTGSPRSNGIGVKVHQNSQALIHNNVIENHPVHGISVSEGASASITANTIRNNGDTGIFLADAASARIGLSYDDIPGGNVIENNPVDGIQVTNSSSATLHGNTLQGNGFGADGEAVFARQSMLRLAGGNVIRLNNFGIFARASHVRTGAAGFGVIPYTDVISENRFDGISGNENSTIDLRGRVGPGGTEPVTIVNNGRDGIVVNHGSVLEMRETTVSGNAGNGILLLRRSSARFRTSNSVTVNGGFGLFCIGAESSFEGGFPFGGNVAGEISLACTDFN